jgi:hypothetical protein
MLQGKCCIEVAQKPAGGEGKGIPDFKVAWKLFIGDWSTPFSELSVCQFLLQPGLQSVGG